MSKINIALITGGDNAEREISLKSAQTLFNHLDKGKYNTWTIDFKAGVFYEDSSNSIVDKNNFSLAEGKDEINFDLVLLCLHGIPAENGQLQAYFELLGIPYVGCDHFTSALTFDKQACKDFLRAYNIPMAESALIRKEDGITESKLERLKKLDLFVKPNKNGSSYGVTKVNADSDYTDAINKAFQFDDEVIVEEYLKGREFSNGVFLSNKGFHVLPVTEIIPNGDFFDYNAKYKNESSELTPAEIPDQLTKDCQDLTLRLAQILNCKGFVRMDYILVNGQFHFLEANTIPGMSEQSLFPQQLRANGMSIGFMLDSIIEECMA